MPNYWHRAKGRSPGCSVQSSLRIVPISGGSAGRMVQAAKLGSARLWGSLGYRHRRPYMSENVL